MSLSETRTFLEQLVLRYAPDEDVSTGSRADAELIQPILTRIGVDPIDEDMHVFVRERVRQAFGTRIAINEVDEFTDLFIDPARVLFEPLTREVKLLRLRSSLKNVESLSDAEVDALMANFFEERVAGGYATGQVRAYFATPQTVSVTTNSVATTRAGLRFTPTRSQAITRDEMALNLDGSEYYFDINYIASERGDAYNVEENEIVSISNLLTATRVKNLRRFRNGIPREDNISYVARVQRGGGDRALVAEPGIASALESGFPDIRGLLVVGFGDVEMQRDVVKGGGLGTVAADDTLGALYGTGSVTDDGDADATSPYLFAPTGEFVSRVGAIGDIITDWYVTVSYTFGAALVVRDQAILDVRSNTEVEIDHEMPLTATSLIWTLRRRTLTISDIPGGITLPDTAEGELAITGGEVHIGGKTDIYIAGSTDAATATITSLTDEEPLARGDNAETQASTPGSEDIILINDLGIDPALIEPGMSLVLEEGADVGAYRILEVLTAPDRVRVSVDMTGTQGTLAWRIVDDISTELTDPKEIKAGGSDLITASGNVYVTTSGAFNFLDGDIAEGDILEITADPGGGEFTVTEVNAVTLKVDPAPDRTIAAAQWRVFRRSQGIAAPIVRVSKLELLDGTGAPNGTEIPYRDPVLVSSRSFQNEGAGFLFDDIVQAGIVSRYAAPADLFAVGGQTLQWKLMDSDRGWAVVAGGDTGTFTFSGGSKTVAQMVTEINADVTLAAKGIKAVGIAVDGVVFLGLRASRALTITGGTALFQLSFYVGISNSTVRSSPFASLDFTDYKLRTGYVIEFVGGSNVGKTGRFLTPADASVSGAPMLLGIGPEGPLGTSGLYDRVLLSPAVERARIARPSVGSARVYFLQPTSAEFRYATTEFALGGMLYQPDPENQRQILPAPPATSAPRTGLTGTNTLTDTTANFLALSVKPGDVLEILYRPIVGSTAMATPANVPVGGLYLRLRLRTDPYITINFPFDMPRQDVADYINEQVGEDIASLSAGVLSLIADDLLVVDPTSTAVTDGGDPLRFYAYALTPALLSTAHPSARTFVVAVVSETALTLSPETPLTGAVPNTSYKISRYLQRISSTEMNTQVDVSGLYYFDVQMIARAPGDDYNINADAVMEVTGHVSDGYRLTTAEESTSYSRAELVYAEISRSILLVGSSDSPEEYVQLSQQNVLVNYDRSQLVDDVQSFVDSRARRPLCSEPLVRHLLPHYVSLSWNYVGGNAEPAMTRIVLDALDNPDTVYDGLEVDDLRGALRKKGGATSVYSTDPESPTGRGAPVMIVVYHGTDRRVRAHVVKDIVDTVRTQKFLPGTIKLRRVTVGGIR